MTTKMTTLKNTKSIHQIAKIRIRSKTNNLSYLFTQKAENPTMTKF